MGEAQGWLFEPSFNRAVKVTASDDRITSDAGLLLLREADHRLGLTEWLAQRLVDPRRQDLIRYQLVELLRERLYALALGYSAQDDADRLAHDPAMKLAAWNRPGEQPLEERLASQPTQSRLIDILTLTPGNRAALRDALGEACERHLRATGGDHAARKVTIDIDSFPIVVHGQQPGAAYNGHYRETVYHPLVASYSVAGNYDSMQEGHRLGNGFLHAILRQGQVHTAQGVKRFLQEVVRKAKGLGYVVDLRIDAGYTDGATLDLPDRRKAAFSRAIQEQCGARTAGRAASRAAGRASAEGRLRRGHRTGPVSSRVVEASAALAAGDRRSARSEDGPTEPAARLFLSRGRLEAGGTRRSGGAGALSSAGHVRGSPGRVSASHRAASFARRLPGQRSPVAVVAVGLQPGVDAADRIRRRRPAVASIWAAFNATCSKPAGGS